MKNTPKSSLWGLALAAGLALPMSQAGAVTMEQCFNWTTQAAQTAVDGFRSCMYGKVDESGAPWGNYPNFQRGEFYCKKDNAYTIPYCMEDANGGSLTGAQESALAACKAQHWDPLEAELDKHPGCQDLLYNNRQARVMPGSSASRWVLKPMERIRSSIL